ncbi:hypothetical protein GCM10027052_00060 [Parafrigoribacterium mesophilum]|uniref:PilW family protein n=1 Tax=Parafrigoribacterium mesophilum TaxID=433646 RepID=UPI0031FC7078
MNDDMGEDSEKGFTLIELLVYMLLTGLVLAIVGAMMINTMRTSNTVSSVTDASSAGQLVAHSVEKGIRNSSDFLLTSPTGNDQLLLARTALGGDPIQWMCAAWYYSPVDGGSIRYKVSTSAIVVATASDTASWTLLDQGIVPKITAGTPPVPVGIFKKAADERLVLSFSGLAGDHPPVDVTSSAVSRAGATGEPICYP